MSEDVLEGIKLVSRDRMNRIWQKAKAGEFDDLPDEEKHLGEIMLDHEDELFSHLRAGVNAATALLRSGGYRVSLQIKPPEQIEIPGAESGEQPAADPETQADVEPPEEEATEAEATEAEATEAEAAAEKTPPEAPSETGVKVRKRKTAGASAS